MATAHILIVTNGQLSRNPRVVKEASAFGTAGYDVTVLHVVNNAAAEKFDQTLLVGAPFRREVVDMLGLERGERLQVWLTRLTCWLARNAATRLRWRTIHSLGPAHLLLRRARALSADLTIVHNEVPHWVGTCLLAEGRRVAADVEDWHSEDLIPDDQIHRPLRSLRRNEKCLLHNASYVSTTSEALSKALYTRYGGKKPVVVTNSFPLQSEPTRSAPGQPPALFWYSQTIGPGRGLELFLAVWRQTTQPSRLVLLGEPQVGYREKIMSCLPEAFRARVEFLPLVPPEELPSVIARHDIGLALEERSILNRDLTITNKILQYLNAGLAVVASDTAGQREVLTKAPEAGIVVELQETAAVARSLDQLLSNRAELRKRQVAARNAAEKYYCWEREAPRLLSIVETALARSH